MSSSSPDQPVIEVVDVSKCYQVYDKPSDRLRQAAFSGIRSALNLPERKYFREFWALQHVSLSVAAGETVGIIGRNGSGKSTLLQIISGILEPTSGSMTTRGRIAALLELGSGFNPEFTGRENVFMNAAILGLTEEEMHDRYASIVAFSELEDFMDQPVKTYSSGMFMRLAFAVQANIDASVLIIDEALTVGDVFFRQKCYARLERLKEEGTAILLVSHSMPDIEQFCERAIVLDGGHQRFSGPAEEASKCYYLLNQTATGNNQADQAVSDALDGAVNVVDSDTEVVEAGAYYDISACPQVTDGSARCVSVALTDSQGHAKRVFSQGETAIFHYEFDVFDSTGTPVAGMTIANERGIIVHGKNSLQFDHDPEFPDRPCRRIAVRQSIDLCLAVGDYTFEVGLAAVDASIWRNRTHIPYDFETAAVRRMCHLAKVGEFSVKMGMRNGVPFLSHHGVADLAGTIQVKGS